MNDANHLRSFPDEKNSFISGALCPRHANLGGTIRAASRATAEAHVGQVQPELSTMYQCLFIRHEAHRPPCRAECDPVAPTVVRWRAFRETVPPSAAGSTDWDGAAVRSRASCAACRARCARAA